MIQTADGRIVRWRFICTQSNGQMDKKWEENRASTKKDFIILVLARNNMLMLKLSLSEWSHKQPSDIWHCGIGIMYIYIFIIPIPHLTLWYRYNVLYTLYRYHNVKYTLLYIIIYMLQNTVFVHWSSTDGLLHHSFVLFFLLPFVFWFLQCVVNFSNKKEIHCFLYLQHKKNVSALIEKNRDASLLSFILPH